MSVSKVVAAMQQLLCTQKLPIIQPSTHLSRQCVFMHAPRRRKNSSFLRYLFLLAVRLTCRMNRVTVHRAEMSDSTSTPSSLTLLFTSLAQQLRWRVIMCLASIELTSGVMHPGKHLVCLWAPFSTCSNQHDALRAAGLGPLPQPEFPDHQREVWPALASRAGAPSFITVEMHAGPS